MSAREEVLARIRAAHAAAPPPDLPYAALSRDYRTSSALDVEALVERLVDRLLDYKALVRRCSVADLPAALATALRERGVRRLVAPAGLDPSWLAAVDTGVDVRTDDPDVGAALPVAELDVLDGVVSGCALAVAETGTLVLDGSAGQGRRVISLIPDYHLCVVLPGQVVADVPQAVLALDLTRPTTMISGPSATSDIELNRVEGVHGPRTLEVLVVER
ncbi:L-lactate dehydrogenase complex protein LldG [Friedmanniella luteola]|uniref:L-lactate dehydrogenase complex protein LldG n=1 Tax=Friedmanniella luteola TaxID=546871 RepID=A0A1H1ZC52_9ACTN|nr:LUD domain-containing protein [Friedmanniella luteola]SDT31137.1 L-lactate dehydrogenase complex protein LldG [Friedmanniella luteola]